ncbi:MAG: hypothetical protein ACTHMM_21315 [Agriterribacter sp.]
MMEEITSNVIQKSQFIYVRKLPTEGLSGWQKVRLNQQEELDKRNIKITFPTYIEPLTKIGNNVSIGPLCTINKHVVIQDEATIEGGVIISQGSTIGSKAVLKEGSKVRGFIRKKTTVECETEVNFKTTTYEEQIEELHERD